MSDVVIRAEGLGKRYRIRHQQRERYTSLRDVIADRTKRLFAGKAAAVGGPAAVEDFWALRDVSFEVRRGEVLGIIGRNGAGKSTLLKILSRITEPTAGRVTLDGRVASLLEVGTGFHPELTGRENIALNGAILGMSGAEITRKFDEIVDFAGVERFLDTPVKHYSSGMYVRLAFAVAAHLEPEILIVDEVLAVGDAEFREKCLGKMNTVSRQGRTVIFVSHDMGALGTLTQRAILIDQGRITQRGVSLDVVAAYMASSRHSTSDRHTNMDSFRRRQNDASPVKIVDVKAEPPCSGPEREMAVGSDLKIAIDLDVSAPLQDANVTVCLKTALGQTVCVIASWDNDYRLSLGRGLHTVTMTTAQLPLSPGEYMVDVGIDASMHHTYDAIFDYPLCSVSNHGQVIHWLERPWGPIHCTRVAWGATGRSSS